MEKAAGAGRKGAAAGAAAAAAAAAAEAGQNKKKRGRLVAEDDKESFQPPKLPRTLQDRDSAKRLIVILEQASLETVKVGKSFQLLNSTDHANILRKHNRDGINLRPDITHQCLLMLLDSPLNKAGLLQVYIHTAKNVLIEVNPQTRIPRIYSRFCGLMVQLLHDLSISAKGPHGRKLLKVIKNPVTDHLPTGCVKIGTSYGAKKCVKLHEFVPSAIGLDRPFAVVIGAVAHGSINADYVDDDIAISNYAMSAAGVCARFTNVCEDLWGVH